MFKQLNKEKSRKLQSELGVISRSLNPFLTCLILIQMSRQIYFPTYKPKINILNQNRHYQQN